MNHETENTENDKQLTTFDFEGLNRLAEEQPEETVTGTRISTMSGIFSIGEQELGTSIEVYLLAINYKNIYYDREMNPDIIRPPACYALTLASKKGFPVMMPADNVPKKQNDLCATCWANRFKSARNKKGKACGNRRILAVIPSDKVMSGQDLLLYEVPPTSTEGLKEYLNRSSKRMLESGKETNIPYWALKTKITLTPIPKKQFKAHKFELLGIMAENERPTAYGRIQEANDLTMALMDCDGYEDPEEETKRFERGETKQSEWEEPTPRVPDIDDVF